LARVDKGWLDIGLDTWLLGAEASMVIVLRAARLAEGGPGACREARLMVDEKVESCLELGTALATGRLGTDPQTIAGRTVAHFRRGVRKNWKRLARR
jgi:hypothetical protein